MARHHKSKTSVCVQELRFANNDFYHPQRSWGKVIFSVACVKNSVHSGGSTWAGTPWQVHPLPPWASTPLPPAGRYTPLEYCIRDFCGLVQLSGFHKMLGGSIRLKWKLVLWHLFSCSEIVNNPSPRSSELRPNGWVFMVRRGAHGDKLGISKTPYTLHDDSYGRLRCQEELYSALFDPLNWPMDDYLNEFNEVIAYIAVCQFNVCTAKGHIILSTAWPARYIWVPFTRK